MTVIESLVAVLGEFPEEFEFLLYGAALLFFMLFMEWTFGLISRVLLDYLFHGRNGR